MKPSCSCIRIDAEFSTAAKYHAAVGPLLDPVETREREVTSQPAAPVRRQHRDAGQVEPRRGMVHGMLIEPVRLRKAADRAVDVCDEEQALPRERLVDRVHPVLGRTHDDRDVDRRQVVDVLVRGRAQHGVHRRTGALRLRLVRRVVRYGSQTSATAASASGSVNAPA